MNTVGKKGMLGARRAVRRLGGDAHRGLGRQHGHPHPRHPRVPVPAALRAGRRPRAATPVVRRRTTRAGSRPSTPTSTASRSCSSAATSPPRTPHHPSPPPRSSVDAGREHLRIAFPKLDGYRLEVPDEQLWLPDELEPFVIGPGTVPTWTESAPVVGTPELVEDDVDDDPRPRPSRSASPKRLVEHHFALGEDIDDGEVKAEPRPWLFPRLAELCLEWIDRAVVVEPGWHLGHLAKYAQWQARACDAVYDAINQPGGGPTPTPAADPAPPRPRRLDRDVSFATRKVAPAHRGRPQPTSATSSSTEPGATPGSS